MPHPLLAISDEPGRVRYRKFIELKLEVSARTRASTRAGAGVRAGTETVSVTITVAVAVAALAAAPMAIAVAALTAIAAAIASLTAVPASATVPASVAAACQNDFGGNRIQIGIENFIGLRRSEMSGCRTPGGYRCQKCCQKLWAGCRVRVRS